MPKKLEENIRDAYETEKVACHARIDQVEPDDDRIAGWQERIETLNGLLGVSKRAAKKETRPAPAVAEKRPQE